MKKEVKTKSGYRKKILVINQEREKETTSNYRIPVLSINKEKEHERLGSFEKLSITANMRDLGQTKKTRKTGKIKRGETNFMQRVSDYINIFFKNLDSISATFDMFIEFLVNTYHAITSTMAYKVIYYIPHAMLELIKITIRWYYENFINNELMLGTPVRKVLFIYAIPALTVYILFNILALEDGLGFRLLIASPVIFIFFPFCVLYGIFYIYDKKLSYGEDKIEAKHQEVARYSYPTGEWSSNYMLSNYKRWHDLLDYALKYVKGYKKTISNIFLPIDDETGEQTEVGAVIINEHGIFLWNVNHHNYRAAFWGVSYYGKSHNGMWYVSESGNAKAIVESAIKQERGDVRIRTLQNPLWQNRMQVNLLREYLKSKGIENVQIFSGIGFPRFMEDNSDVETFPDEAVCELTRLPKTVAKWGELSQTTLTKEQVDEIAAIISELSDTSFSARMAHMDKIEEIYDVRNEYEIDIYDRLEKLGIEIKREIEEPLAIEASVDTSAAIKHSASSNIQ